MCGLCVPPIGADTILRCGQLGVDMAGRELAASDIVVLVGGLCGVDSTALGCACCG